MIIICKEKKSIYRKKLEEIKIFLIDRETKQKNIQKIKEMSIEKDFRNLRNLPFNSFHFWSHFNSVTAFNIYGVESNFNSYRFFLE